MMYHVIIVDDEAEIRRGLRHKIDWHTLGFDIVGEAADGLEALELLGSHPVHLMITDIRMPVMDGMALLSEQRACYPDVCTIILSGYDDFAYAKAAMQHGARDYLLKPVARKELSAMLAALREELDVQRQALSQRDQMSWKYRQTSALLQEHLVLELISGDHTEDAELTERIHERQLDHLFCGQEPIRFISTRAILTPERLGSRLDQAELMRTAFQMMCRELAQAEPDHVFAFHDWSRPGFMHFVVNYGDDEQSLAQLERFAHHVQRQIRGLLRLETVMVVGYASRGIAGLKESYDSSLLVWSQAGDGGCSEVIWASRIADEQIDYTPEIQKKLELLLEGRDHQAISVLLSTLLRMRPYTMQSIAILTGKILLTFDGVAQKNGIRSAHVQQLFMAVPELVRGFTSVTEAIDRLSGIATELQRILSQAKSAGGENVALSVREYIDRNYASDLGLAQLAEQFFINPTYLSELFKRYVGQTFSDYVISVRIAKAEQYLHDPMLRLADIAELVGFSTASYLSSVFKKHYGKSPNEYRASMPADRS